MPNTTKKAISGIDVTISFNEGGVVHDIGGQGEANLFRESTVVDITIKASKGKREFIVVADEWTVECDGFILTDDKALTHIHNSLNKQTPLTCVLTGGDGFKMTGQCYVQSIKNIYPERDKVTYNIVFRGTNILEDI